VFSVQQFLEQARNFPFEHKPPASQWIIEEWKQSDASITALTLVALSQTGLAFPVSHVMV